ncbi:MAG: anthranilate phosphoribosyltransferase, partial [Clostridiaceae bacterium]|nr:anthranilate phosphoribosyltransferase [Clostridiaceae bacterium]
SADVLEGMGININLTPVQVQACIEKVGIGFMFAPTFHKSMKHAAGPRKELGIRTVFNILGPLTNPANAKGQVLGVFNKNLTESVAKVLLNLGVERAMVIHGMDGMDEITTTTSTMVSEVKEGEVLTYEINPENYDLRLSSKDELNGGDSKDNSEIIISLFNGRLDGPKKDILLLNSAAALYVGKKAPSIEAGIEMAEEIIDSGRALQKLNELREYTNSFTN